MHVLSRKDISQKTAIRLIYIVKQCDILIPVLLGHKMTTIYANYNLICVSEKLSTLK